MKRALLAASFLALPLAARAQPVSGLYVGAGAGGDLAQDEKSKITSITRSGSHPVVQSGAEQSFFDPGPAAVASIGYGFGNGLRLELEGNGRRDWTRNSHSSNDYLQSYGAMVNTFFDFDVGSPYIWPYAGIGAGYLRTERRYNVLHGDGGSPVLSNNDFHNHSSGGAVQGIAGLAFPIPWVVGLSATLEYRAMVVQASQKTSVFNYAVVGSGTSNRKTEPDVHHSALIGLRYAFNVTPPASPAAPPTPNSAATAAPAAAPSRSYLVFFDWDRADVSDRARQIIAEAARNIARVAHTRIEVAGNADRSGTARYNQALSLRRAQNVAAELVRLGVARANIDIEGFGDTHPLVPTAAGVREPQNRRVEIVIH